jgi:Domain of unknown function (DUF4136)
MKKLYLLSLLLAGLLLAGCSSTPTHVNKGALPAHTFNFVNGGISLTPPAVDRRDTVHQQIQAAIIKSLAAKGSNRTNETGDVIVAYMIVLGNNVSTEAITTYFGSGRDAGALHHQAHAAYTGNLNPDHFAAGTLLIDVIDAKTYELRYRDFAVQPAMWQATTEERAGHIQAAVDAALAKVRVAN